jgi:hypothetical protein
MLDPVSKKGIIPYTHGRKTPPGNTVMGTLFWVMREGKQRGWWAV